MSDLLPELPSQITNNTLSANIESDIDQFICPCQGYSICNIPASICHWLDTPVLKGSPLLESLLTQPGSSFQNVILLVMDCLGFKWLQQNLNDKLIENTLQSNNIWKELLPEANKNVLTSIVPSTTATALTTFWTGCSPIEHGMLGYEMWLKEYGLIANMILFSPAAFGYNYKDSLVNTTLQPENFLKVPTLGSHLNAHKISVFAHQPAHIAKSGLSRLLMTDAKMIPYTSLPDLWSSVSEGLEENQHQKTYRYIYWPRLDETAHRYGADSTRMALEFNYFGLVFNDFLRHMKQKKLDNTLILITSDHGIINTPPKSKFELNNHPEFLSYLSMLPSGENRFAYLFSHPKQEKNIRSYISKHWNNDYQLLSSKKILESNLLGKSAQASQSAIDRIGDWILIPQNNSYLWWANKTNTLKARHGGLSPDEMLVPLLSWVV